MRHLGCHEQLRARFEATKCLEINLRSSSQPAGDDLSIPGQCIAAAHLFGTVDADGSNASGPDGQIVLGSHPMPAGHYVLAVQKFTVGGTANKKF